MDREIVIDVLLLVALTWLLYKLTVMLEPRDKPGSGKSHHDASTDPSVLGVSESRQKPINQRLRK